MAHPCRDEGLSPRTRGKPHHVVREEARGGPIPANAGETGGVEHHSQPRRAYPRERGGNEAKFAPREPDLGLSPRTRGKRLRLRVGDQRLGPIPANAGETILEVLKVERMGAYPRERGGNPSQFAPVWTGQGLSPRTRGKPASSAGSCCCLGPIPANAGETVTSPSFAVRQRAYPRERGGNTSSRRRINRAKGLSPRTRGKRKENQRITNRPGPIPANAGET